MRVRQVQQAKIKTTTFPWVRGELVTVG
jgi:hypothetical protein